MIPSARLYGLLIIGGAIALVIAIVMPFDARLQIAILMVLVYDVAIFALALWDSQRVKTRRITIQRGPMQRFSINRNNVVTLTVMTQAAATVQIRDGYSSDLDAHSFSSLPDHSQISVPVLSTSLPAQTTQDLTYTVRPQRRGLLKWGDINVQQLGDWGLAWHRWTVPQPESVKVYPDLVGLRDLTIRLTLQSAGSIHQARRRGIGTEFAELRDYTIGDDPRLIDWKATARRNRPLVRVLEPEHEQTLIILLDRGRLMTAQVQGLTRFDWGLNATLALALTGLNRGDRVGVGVFDRQVHLWIPPERGQHQLPKLIERLATVQPVLLESDYFTASTSLVTQQTRRALVVVITDLIDVTASAELLSALSQLTPRYLPFCVTLRDPDLNQQAHQTGETVAELYARAVALDLLNQRQLAFAELRQQGVLVLDAPANQISDQLVEDYLQLKARNRI